MRNFRQVDWEQFHKILDWQLEQQDPATTINTQAQLDKAYDNLTNTIQETISKTVPVTTICAKTKQWWIKELTMLLKESKRLERQSYKHRDKPFHYTHKQYMDAT